MNIIHQFNLDTSYLLYLFILERKKLRRTQRVMERIIQSISFVNNRINNEKIRERTKLTDIISVFPNLRGIGQSMLLDDLIDVLIEMENGDQGPEKGQSIEFPCPRVF